MSTLLYNFLPTEIVWKIYEDLHRSYMNDLCEELRVIFLYGVVLVGITDRRWLKITSEQMNSYIIVNT